MNNNCINFFNWVLHVILLANKRAKTAIIPCYTLVIETHKRKKSKHTTSRWCMKGIPERFQIYSQKMVLLLTKSWLFRMREVNKKVGQSFYP